MDRLSKAREIYERYIQQSDDGSTNDQPEDLVRKHPDVERELRAIFENEEKLDSAVADYLQQLDSGAQPESKVLLSGHPELEDFFSASQEISQLTDEPFPTEASGAQPVREDRPQRSDEPLDRSSEASSSASDRPARKAADLPKAATAEIANPQARRRPHRTRKSRLAPKLLFVVAGFCGAIVALKLFMPELFDRPTSKVAPEITVEVHLQRADESKVYKTLESADFPLSSGDKIQVFATLQDDAASNLYIARVTADGQAHLWWFDGSRTRLFETQRNVRASARAASISAPSHDGSSWLKIVPPAVNSGRRAELIVAMSTYRRLTPPEAKRLLTELPSVMPESVPNVLQTFGSGTPNDGSEPPRGPLDVPQMLSKRFDSFAGVLLSL